MFIVELFCVENLSILPHWFIYSIIYISIWTLEYLFYTLCYNLILLYLLGFPNCTGFGYWKIFQLTPMSLWHTLIIVRVFVWGVFLLLSCYLVLLLFLFLSILLSGTARCFRVILYTFCPVLETAISPNSAGSFCF